jgi:putative ABC transport system permease protein
MRTARVSPWPLAIRFAALGIVRQPVRSALAVLGVAAVGALLFDMLLLSRGLVVSFRDLLDRAGYDVRVLASGLPPLVGPRLTDASGLAASIAALPDVRSVLRIKLREAELAAVPAGPDHRDEDAASPGVEPRRRVEVIGADPQAPPLWTLLEGRDLARSEGVPGAVVVNRNVIRTLGLSLGDSLALRARCPGAETLPPMPFTIAGTAEFPFDDTAALTVAATLADVDRLCPEGENDSAEMLLVGSTGDAGRTAAAIRGAHPDLHVVTNEELIERFSRVEFSYFRQISFVLTVVTLFFGFLLIGVLLTVSVNGRLGEIAALRAIGLSRGRLAAGVLVESILLIGAGGILALPAGAALSIWLEAILHRMPGIPVGVSFFVFEPRALLLHGALLGAAAVGAALYPMRMVSTLPIAQTLRREVIS